MLGDFSIVAARPEDLDEISRLLNSCHTTPPDSALLLLSDCISNPCDQGAPLDKPYPDEPRIVVDRTGAIRGFCITRRLHHALHGNMLDVPILAIEDGPNRDEIARVLFDDLVESAGRVSCDALRLLPLTMDAWRRWLNTSPTQVDDVGILMPLSVGGRDPQYQNDESAARDPSFLQAS